jgi:hypothetical protein
VDYKLKLTESITLGYYPLYKISVEHLEVAKVYIYENVKKGFIVPSLALFISLILIAKKLGRGLRFYVNYRKLNSIIKKDIYPLPLIDKIIYRLRKARYFIKLDIR